MDPTFYGSYYPDLRGKTVEELQRHWNTYGRIGGRVGTEKALRFYYYLFDPDYYKARHNKTWEDWLQGPEGHCHALPLIDMDDYDPEDMPGTLEEAIKRRKLGDFPLGVNVIGYVNNDCGLSENPKSIVKALECVGIPYKVKSVMSDHKYRETDLPIDNSCPYLINIICLDNHHVPKLTKDIVKGRVNIILWAWELELPQPMHVASAKYFDDIWTISNFTKACLEKEIDRDIAVLKIPPSSLGCSKTRERSREEFLIPEGSFVVLFFFDLFSSVGRKNPYAVIDAFNSSISDKEDALLIIKTINGDHHAVSDDYRRLREQSKPNIRIFNKLTTRDESMSLINACDVYISLHRSEGSGLTLIEAMSMGKPVIATNYSGNLDFMNDSNSLLVDWEYCDLQGYYAGFGLNCKWANPDIGCAAAHLKLLYHNPELRQKIGTRAREYIEKEWTHQQLGLQIADRLEGWLKGKR